MRLRVQLLRDEDVRTKSSGHFEGNLGRKWGKGKVTLGDWKPGSEGNWKSIKEL